jgi:hypothetical protein
LNLFKLMIHNIAHADIFEKDNELRRVKRNINILFTIKKDGTIGDQILILSAGDSIINEELHEFIEQTNGKWINNTGEDQLVILPVVSSLKEYSINKSEH